MFLGDGEKPDEIFTLHDDSPGSLTDHYGVSMRVMRFSSHPARLPRAPAG